MTDKAEALPVPFEECTEDEMRTIARDYAEHHGAGEEPDMRELIGHCLRVLTRMRQAPTMPDDKSMDIITSLIRRSTTAVELPTALEAPTRVLTEDERRGWARYIRDEWGPDIPPGMVRQILALEYTDEISANCIAAVIELVDEARALVQLPGDTEFVEAPYPGREDPRSKRR